MKQSDKQAQAGNMWRGNKGAEVARVAKAVGEYRGESVEVSGECVKEVAHEETHDGTTLKTHGGTTFSLQCG